MLRLQIAAGNSGKTTPALNANPTGCCGRFAPSPSGPLHFGSLVAALGSFLDARRRDGEWLVRIEDIDTPRVVRGAAESILKSLEYHGLHWDRTVVYQSRRTELYQDALQCLANKNLIYFCTCSRRQIAQSAAPGLDGARIYPGTCRGNMHKPPASRAAAIRVRTDDGLVRFRDQIQGDVRQRLQSQVGDFVVRRADGIFAYQLAVVVDDAEQGVTDVVRGSDLLDSTARQIYLQRSLGLPTPEYKHLPLVIDEAGAKLSKQTKALALDDKNPAPALFSALRFLRQQPPQELAAADVKTILAWAVQNWQPENISKIHALSFQ